MIINKKEGIWWLDRYICLVEVKSGRKENMGKKNEEKRKNMIVWWGTKRDGKEKWREKLVWSLIFFSSIWEENK